MRAGRISHRISQVNMSTHSVLLRSSFCGQVLSNIQCISPPQSQATLVTSVANLASGNSNAFKQKLEL